MRLFNRPFLHSWRWLTPLLLSLALAASMVSHAQANGAQQVVVTLRDATDRGLDQAVVTMKTLEGDVLATGSSDRDGIVRLSVANPTKVIHLTVRGVSAMGKTLRLAASERDGITVRLQAPTTAIDLRVEDNGTVLPDPATMAEPAWIPLPPAPTRQLPAPTAIGATSEPAYQQPAPAEFVDANGHPIPAQEPSHPIQSVTYALIVLAVIPWGIWLILRPVRGGKR